jgi:hypothetical protein
MKILYFEPSNELLFEGDSYGYGAIATVVESGGTLDVYPSLAPDDLRNGRLIRTLDVKHSETDKVLVWVVGDTLMVEGDSESLKQFSAEIRNYGDNFDSEQHLDIFYYGDDERFLRVGSAIMTLEHV